MSDSDLFDLDIAFAAAVVAEGSSAIRELVAQNFPPDRLQGPARPVVEFLFDYHRKHRKAPGADIVTARFGVVLPEPPAVAVYLADELRRRHLGATLRSALGTVLAAMEKGEYDNAAALLEQARTAARKAAGLSRLREFRDLLPDVVAHYDKIQSGARGILSPWPTIDNATLGWWPNDFILFVARQGAGKCVEESTEVTDPVTGLPRTIAEVYSDPSVQRVTTWSAEKGIHAAPITAKVDTGTKRCLRVTYASGRAVVVTPEHPLLTPDGWRRADAIGVGTTTALPARMPHPEAPSPLPEHEVDLLALFLADGTSTGNHVGFSKADPSIVALAHTAAARLGGVRVVARQDDNYDFVRVAPSGPNAVRELLRRHGIDGVLSKHKVVPRAVYSLSADQLARFLTVLWMCDGYVDKAPCITLASERMVRQIQSLLLRFGVQSGVAYRAARCGGKTFPSWRLTVYAHSLNAFAESFRLWGEKGRRLAALAGRRRNPNVGGPRISAALRDRLVSVAAATSGRWGDGRLKKVGARRGTRFEPRMLFGAHGALRLGPFRDFAAVYPEVSDLLWLASPDIFWDVVASVEDAGECRIYDLTVSPTACFVANDIVVHNTWASVVLAVHAWLAGYSVLYATTEMAGLAIARRMVALMLRLPYGDFRRAALDPVLETKFKQMPAEAALAALPGFYIGGGDFRLDTLELRGFIETVEPDLIVCDGAYLIDAGGKDRVDKAKAVYDLLKVLPGEYKRPLIATTQFNRAGAKEVAAENISGSDAGGWNADAVFGLSRSDDQKRDRQMAICPLKIREAELPPEVVVWWNFQTMNFSEVAEAAVSGEGYTPGLDEAEPPPQVNLPKLPAPNPADATKEPENCPF